MERLTPRRRKEVEMSVTLRKIRESDLETIMGWRMDPEITRYMNTDPRLTLEGQKKWYASVRENPDVRYWMILVDGQEAGQDYAGRMAYWAGPIM